MSATVTRLPTAAPSYFTVNKAGSWWAVQLITPTPFNALRTTVARFTDREEAMAFGRERAAAMHRPFKGKAVVS